MTSLANRFLLEGAFDPVIAVARKIMRLNPYEIPSRFENRFETLMALFYDRLLDLDARLESEGPPFPAATDRFMELLETGRQFDELWDAYHGERLDLEGFSRRMQGIRG